MPQWLVVAISLAALVVAGFALLRVNRVDQANRAAFAQLAGRETAIRPVVPTTAPPAPSSPDPLALRRVAVVRYDAFPDVGGRLSHSVALLTERGDGIVLSTIHTRSEARSYAKRVLAGKGETALSPEEQAAVDEAIEHRA